jgi:F-type H+-transporting ATPase subunit epsilon
MASFTVEIYTPEQNLYLGRAEALTARAIDGEFQILPGHAPYMNILAAGDIRLNTEENTCLHFKHNGGVLEVSEGKVLALVS